MSARRQRRLGKTGRSDGDPKHVRFYRWELASDAYRDMSCIARCAVLEIRHRFNGENNGFIGFSEREMGERLNVSRRTARNALREATDHGWIRPMSKGAFTLKTRHSTEWMLTSEGYPKPTDTPTRDYMRWTKAPATPKKSAITTVPDNIVQYRKRRRGDDGN